jgi:RND family efflux transporter MFP subunit
MMLAGCGGEEEVEQAPVARPVKMLTLAGGATGGMLEYPGTISAAQEAELSFEVQGKITQFPVSEGQLVDEGALLARVDPHDYQTAVDAASSRRKEAKADYERHQELYASNAVSQSDLEVKRRQYEVADADLKTAQKSLRDTYLKAPFAGRVARKLVEDFENVRPKQPVLLLQDDTSLEVVINIPEADAAISRRGADREEHAKTLNPMVTVSSFPDRSFPATVKEFSTAADPTTRTFKATLAFKPPNDVSILPGMTAKVTVTAPAGDTAGAPRGFSIPSNAVAADETGRSYVWVVDPSSMTVSRKYVEVGDLTGAQTEVLSGLAGGDVIATSGVHHLRDGMKVKKLGE